MEEGSIGHLHREPVSPSIRISLSRLGPSPPWPPLRRASPSPRPSPPRHSGTTQATPLALDAPPGGASWALGGWYSCPACRLPPSLNLVRSCAVIPSSQTSDQAVPTWVSLVTFTLFPAIATATQSAVSWLAVARMPSQSQEN